jgi:desulfoferrodoxin (superoxide reductase-like protein)
MRIECFMLLSAVSTGLLSLGCGNPPKGDGPAAPPPKYHTQDNSGAWMSKKAEHDVRIKRLSSGKIEVTIPLQPTMHPPHYIEVIALQDDKENEIVAHGFKPSYIPATATFELPDTTRQYYVVAKCNMHDMWIGPVPNE